MSTLLERANRITIASTETGIMATFRRTHRVIASISQADTGFNANPEQNKTLQRESFRQYMIDNAEGYGIKWDPSDNRMDINKRRSVYKTEEDIIEDAISMITPDITQMIQRMPWADMITDTIITCDSISPKYETAKGVYLDSMGIEDGKYANGNYAWMNISISIEMQTADETIYQLLQMELVSGQLKKFKMTQTAWNSEIKTSLIEMGIIKEEEGI